MTEAWKAWCPRRYAMDRQPLTHLHKATRRLLLSRKGHGGQCSALQGDDSNPETTPVDRRLPTLWTVSIFSCSGTTVPLLGHACGNPFPNPMMGRRTVASIKGEAAAPGKRSEFFDLENPWLG
jgi:hypothetical protein